MLIINEQTIRQSVEMSELIDAMERALKIAQTTDFLMPQRMHAEYKGDTLLLMPAFLPEVFGTKLVSVYPENHKLGKPAIYGAMVLNDGKSGEPIALLNGAALTAYRTAAVSGVAVRHLSPKTTSAVGLVGCGVQGYHQLLAAISERPIEQIMLFDAFAGSAHKLAQKLQAEFPNLHIIEANSAEELTERSQLIICATTSEHPVLPNNKALLTGKSVIAVGSYKPDMRELPDALVALPAKVFTDTEHALHETGDFIDPINSGIIKAENVVAMGKLLNNEATSTSETTVFKSVGMAIFDVVAAQYLYGKVKEAGVGTEIDF